MAVANLRALFQYTVTNLWKHSFNRLSITAMKPHEIQEKLGLTRIRDRNWYVQPSCATSGDGLYEGLTWLTSNHKL